MKLKFLLVLIFISGIVKAQCDYPSAVNRTLIISEARIISENWTYLELTNVGTSPIFMSNYKIGKLTHLSWGAGILDLCNDPWWMPEFPAYIFLPEKVLMPGQSWVITTAYDFGPEYYREHEGRLGGSERPKQLEMYEVADKLIHRPEPINGVIYPGDSISNPIDDPEQTVKRGEYLRLYSAISNGTFFIEHHFSSTDSAVVDQVGGFFDGADGRNISGSPYPIAGVPFALENSVLVRKNTITNGNIDFANSVGISIDDSDWLPIPMPSGYDQWRDIWWTIGNHGDYVLDENTLEPTLDGLTVDYANKVITVPWGIRRLDDIMRNMARKPGIAWNYILNDVPEDSLFRSAQTGDKLTVYAVGNTLTQATFDIVVSEPTADVNIVIPIDHVSGDPALTPRTQDGILDWPRVSNLGSGMDTITGVDFGLEFDMRVDTLLKYLEKPSNATWEIVWVDGVQRADLKNGDKLKVTSESGIAKEYFIQVQTFLPSSNALLSAITWPDIPEFYRDFLGWTGDTIPAFSSGSFNYKIEVPFDVEGVPALVPTPQDYNATIKTTRAKSITGSKEDRTVTFEVTAEDDTSKAVYSIEFIKEKHPDNVEPYYSHPIYSEFVNSYTRNAWLEIYNPGTLPIDLRNYAFSMDKYTDNGYDVITDEHSWLRRYSVYIPGLKYVDSLTYQISPETLIQDVNVNPILQPGECFVMALIGRDDQNDGYFAPYDVNFFNEKIPGHPNPWNENVDNASSNGVPILPNGIRENSMFMYHLIGEGGDSIKNGTKGVNDPNDFEIIDMMGMPAPNFQWIVGDFVAGNNQAQDIYRRKPHVQQGNPIPGGAFAPLDEEASEWTRISPSAEYGDLPNTIEVALGGVGTHYMEPITIYRSTVNSMIFKVSPGFGQGQEILGLTTGTTVSDFLTGIYKEDEGQTLIFMSGADTTNLLNSGDVISPDDILKVISADNSNTTYYRLDVTDDGLSSDAVLTSSSYTIEIQVSPDAQQDIVGEATISGFDFQTTLQTLLDNINLPAGASLTFINSKGDYVALKTLNYDTVYVDTRVSSDIAIEVVAEDALTTIIYDLVPESSPDDAFILSDVYLISQTTFLIEFVPDGVTFAEFLNNIIIPDGAKLKLIDKFGVERTEGDIKADDKVAVTSANNQVTNYYYISLILQYRTYLAYVVSNEYTVNQANYTIFGGSAVSEQTTVEVFLSNLEPATDATIELFDENGTGKTTGNLAVGDYVIVTAGDGVLKVNYDVLLNYVSVEHPGLLNFEIYPNPTDGLLNIKGLSAGNRIHIYNLHGKLIKEFETHNNHETINLENMPNGLFFIIISDENQMLGQFKAVKK